MVVGALLVLDSNDLTESSDNPYYDCESHAATWQWFATGYDYPLADAEDMLSPRSYEAL